MRAAGTAPRHECSKKKHPKFRRDHEPHRPHYRVAGGRKREKFWRAASYYMKCNLFTTARQVLPIKALSRRKNTKVNEVPDPHASPRGGAARHDRGNSRNKRRRCWICCQSEAALQAESNSTL